MTKDIAEQWAKLFQGVASGGELQLKLLSGKPGEQWVYRDRPCFDFEPTCYRIKPATKLRPWKLEEFPLGCWVRLKAPVLTPAFFDPKELLLVTSASVGGVTVGRNSCTFSDMLKLWEHSTDGGKTWKPCGVEE